jgi:2-amino-4-hydroxy-6-hydroxymethyldihydropteridine diphosphokinase
MTVYAFLGLGTNLGDREENLRKTIAMIVESIGEVVLCSSVYQTEPWGFQSENEFLNAVIKVKTSLKPSGLLGRILMIEAQLGRLREGKGYSSRIIDIDILLYGNEIISKKSLQIPHPLIQDRRFTLVPLCDIASEMVHPVLRKTFKELLEECKDLSIVKRTKLINLGVPRLQDRKTARPHDTYNNPLSAKL